MSKIRIVKKDLKKLALELKKESKTYLKLNSKANAEKVNKILLEIDKKVNEMVYKINHTKEVKNIKKYFNELIEKQSELLISTLDKLEK